MSEDEDNTDEEEEARHRNPPKYRGIDPAPGIEESENPPEIDEDEDCNETS